MNWLRIFIALKKMYLTFLEKFLKNPKKTFLLQLKKNWLQVPLLFNNYLNYPQAVGINTAILQMKKTEVLKG